MYQFFVEDEQVAFDIDQKTGKIYIFDRQSEGELRNQRVLVEVPVPVQVLPGKIE